MRVFPLAEVSHAEYNAFVQRVQVEADRWGIEVRLEDRRSGDAVHALFNAYWDGHWWTLAQETPFVPEAERHCQINPDGWVYLQHEMAAELARS